MSDVVVVTSRGVERRPMTDDEIAQRDKDRADAEAREAVEPEPTLAERVKALEDAERSR